MVSKTQQSGIDAPSLGRLAGTLLIVVLAYWKAWQWYFKRISSSPEEAIGLLAILLFMICWAGWSFNQHKRLYQFPLWPVSLMLTIYGLSFLLPVPSIIRAAIAFTCLFLVIYRSVFDRWPPVSFWGLIAVSLPVVPSLQFYLGYPARVISASLTVPLLQLNGVSVSQSGTNLVWQGQLLQFDAPCSGVNMLWASVLLALFIALVFRFNLMKTIVALFVAGLFTLFGNVLRASSLFYVETGILSFEQPWLHEGIGMVAFVITAACIVWTLSKIQSKAVLHENQ